MVVHVGLLRAINVGGNRKVPMADLRALFEGLGFVDVRTYVQSGNVVFRGVALLADAPAAEAVVRLDPNRSPGDSFVVDGREMYLSVPNGFGRSKLSLDWIERQLRTTATVRTCGRSPPSWSSARLRPREGTARHRVVGHRLRR